MFRISGCLIVKKLLGVGFMTASRKLKSICESLGIDGSGSVEDNLNKLNELILFKEIYPKMFRHLKRCGGGIVHFRCVHGIAVYMKFTLRQESARDYVDGILSFAQQPNVVVTDIASQVAHHGENRKVGMFSPFRGMLYQWTKENLQLAEDGKLEPVKLKLDSENSALNFYSLCDKFHHKTKKRGGEKAFRDLRMCSDLRFNSSIAEQANSIMKKDRPSFSSMNPINFMFMSRLSLELQNRVINDKNLKRTRRDFGFASAALHSSEKKLTQKNIDERKGEVQLTKQDSKYEDDNSLSSIVRNKNDVGSPDNQRNRCGDTVPNQPKRKKCEVDEVLNTVSHIMSPIHCIEDPQNAETDKLWKTKQHNMVVAANPVEKFCVLRHESFCTFAPNNWLDTSAVEYVLRLLASTSCHESVLVLDSFVTNCIVDGKEKILSRHCMNKITFSKYNFIMGAFNKNESHWNLFCLHLQRKKIFLIDPFGSEPSHTLIERVRTYLSMRQNAADADLGKWEWTVGKLQHPKQTDSHSCGVIVLKIAECLIETFKDQVLFGVSKTDVKMMRYYFARKILSTSGTTVCYYGTAKVFNLCKLQRTLLKYAEHVVVLPITNNGLLVTIVVSGTTFDVWEYQKNAYKCVKSNGLVHFVCK
uniref:uncharacterized protein LOC104265342 isoform X1 n=2 Tax=Ciona intestinalis TaxID=7719 RepID=UPI000EF4C270|nr:uncharacterized protein LOC104265342 isoform X1 [Ciona intestinalis]|eukprot:XP_026690264.1 uncharacterized protein LOC104265342 isoform X1 [Ciona intestinalis]